MNTLDKRRRLREILDRQRHTPTIPEELREALEIFYDLSAADAAPSSVPTRKLTPFPRNIQEKK